MIFRKTKQLNELSERVDKLERILRYSKEEPSFHFKRLNLNYGYTYDLYLYINKTEYVIKNISELSNDVICDKYCELKVLNDHTALFIGKTCYGFEFKFLIDYKNGTYIRTDIDFKESED